MTTDTINNTLSKRFAEPLPDCYERRIIFWFDSEREFESMIDDINITDVKILKLTSDNFFEAKMILSETDTKSNYLVYHPISMPHLCEDWLRDIELYSEEFRADLISMRMDEFNIPQTTPLRRTMKLYNKFFDNKERTAKLIALHNKYETPVQLHIDVMAVLCNTKNNTVQGIIRAVLCDFLDGNNPLESIRKYGSEEAFMEMISKYTGYFSENFSMTDFSRNLIFTALSGVVKSKVLSGLEKYISAENQTFCYNVINEWADSAESEKLYELSYEISRQFDILSRLQKQSTESLADVDCLPFIDEYIITCYMNEIGNDVVKYEDIITVSEKRQMGKWYKRFAIYYDGLNTFAKMYDFYTEHISGFHYGNAEQMWKAYCDGLFRMDTYYRKFHISFRKSLKSASSELDDMFKNIADIAERVYKNWYLTELNNQWCNLIRNDMESHGKIPVIPQQDAFYLKEVSPFVRNHNRIYVIISDAFRYETAVELNEKLIRETNGTAEITSMQSVFPSLTKYGMSALLPHDKLVLKNDMNVFCDDMSTNSTENRDKILKKSCSDNCAVTYETLLSLKTEQRRKLISGADVVYIYHNKIDAVGDKSATENQVFDACQDTIEELTGLVRMIVNSMKGTNIIITSDHGFLYSYQPLDESDKSDRTLIHGTIDELNHRSVIAENNSVSQYLIQIPMKRFSSEKTGFAPYDTIRIKKQGGGINFVHGGVSLQECCVPVIKFRNIKTNSKHFVDIRKVPLQLLSETRRIANNIFSLEFYQTENVSGKTVPAVYELYFSDSTGNAVSDIQIVIADKNTTDVNERITKVNFVLKSQEFSSTEPYYLNIVDKESGALKERIEFNIKVSFRNDFGF